jgi:hypothetical protein
MCGLPTESMFLYPMHVWESFADEGGCPACAAAVAAEDG